MTPNALPADVQAALDRGERLEAIRLVREHAGLGLHEAFEVVAGLRAYPGGTARMVSNDPPSPRPRPARAAGKGGVAERLLNQLLSQAAAGARKNASSAAATTRAHGPSGGGPAAVPRPFTADDLQGRGGLAPGEVPRTSELWFWIVVVAALAAWWFFRR